MRVCIQLYRPSPLWIQMYTFLCFYLSSALPIVLFPVASTIDVTLCIASKAYLKWTVAAREKDLIMNLCVFVPLKHIHMAYPGGGKSRGEMQLHHVQKRIWRTNSVRELPPTITQLCLQPPPPPSPCTHTRSIHTHHKLITEGSRGQDNPGLKRESWRKRQIDRERTRERARGTLYSVNGFSQSVDKYSHEWMEWWRATLWLLVSVGGFVSA